MTLKCLGVKRTQTIDCTNRNLAAWLEQTRGFFDWSYEQAMFSWELEVIFRFPVPTSRDTVSKQAELPDWKQNKFEGVYKFGAAYPMQKRYQILKDVAATGSYW